MKSRAIFNNDNATFPIDCSGNFGVFLKIWSKFESDFCPFCSQGFDPVGDEWSKAID